MLPFVGGKEEFPPFYRKMKNWVAGHKDHSKIEHLLTKNPDGFHTVEKIALLEALAVSQELTQLTKDCPNAVAMVKNDGNPTAAGKALLDARREIYQSTLFNLLSVKFHYVEEEFLGIHDIGDDECGEALLRTLLKWGGSKGMTSEKIMDKALKLVENANKATTLKELDSVAQKMVVQYNYIAPDQRPGIDELLAATLAKVMRLSEVTSLTIEASKALPPAAELKLRGKTYAWFRRIRQIVPHDPPTLKNAFPSAARVAQANAAMTTSWANQSPVRPILYQRQRSPAQVIPYQQQMPLGKGSDGMHQCRSCDSLRISRLYPLPIPVRALHSTAGFLSGLI